MELLVEKLLHSNKISSKVKNHHQCHNHRYEASDEASLQKFYLYISVAKIMPKSDTVSLSWVRNCFSYLSDSNKAFARLVVEIDHPMSKWELPLIEEYLNYSLGLLDHLNLVKSSISHLGHARLLITHALSFVENSPLLAIERLRFIKFKNSDIDLKSEGGLKERKFKGKEVVIHKALIEMKKNSDLVFGILLSILSGNVKPHLPKPEAYLKVFFKKNVTLKEFNEVDEAKACLLWTLEMGENSERPVEDARNLKIKLDEIQKQLDDIGNDARDLFKKILAGRNDVLDVIRH